jgi:uncharacterized cupin superfamily protein
MQATVVPGVSMWSVWQPDRNLFFNSFFLEGGEKPQGNVAIDPLPLSDADAAEIERRGGLATILITNRDHERDARALVARFGAKLAASEADAPLLSGPVDITLRAGDEIAGGHVIAFDGLKTPGEIALFLPERRTVVVGDALWGDPAGSLRLMPDEKLADAPRAALSVRRLLRLRPQHLLLGDGTCLFGDAYRVLQNCLEARRDVYVNRVNMDELFWRRYGDEPPPYGGDRAEVGFLLGAEKLGYQLVRLAPGEKSCPMHWHAVEEEVAIVFEGAPLLETPRGNVRLRKNDFVAFPVGEGGAHKFFNDGTEPCLLFLLANFGDFTDTCTYPDSQKVLVEARDILIRDRPSLDYWDGE